MNIVLHRVSCAYQLTLHVETEVDSLRLNELLTQAEYAEAHARLNTAESALMAVKAVLRQANERRESE